MRIYANPKSRLYPGPYTIYSSVEEAVAVGIVVFTGFSLTSVPKVGDYIENPENGEVLPVLRVSVKNTWYKNYPSLTVPGPKIISISSKRGVSVFDTNAVARSKKLHDVVTNKRICFLEDWLLRGVAMEVAVKQNLENEYYIWKGRKTYNDIVRQAVSFRLFGYHLLGMNWFQQVLDTNRVFREKYMNLVGAFTEAGIDDTYIATKLKGMADGGTERERINAINKIIEVVTAEKMRSGQRVEAEFTIEEELNHRKKQLQDAPKQLMEGPNDKRDQSDEVQQAPQEKPSATVSSSEGNTPVPSFPLDEPRKPDPKPEARSETEKVAIASAKASHLREDHITATLRDLMGEEYVKERLDQIRRVSEGQDKPQEVRESSAQVQDAS